MTEVMRSGSRWRGERGSYTAEFAVAMPALLVLVAWGWFGVAYAHSSLRCDDAARAGARAAARGEPTVAVRAKSEDAAPRGALVEVVRHADTVEVRCAARVRVVGVKTVGVSARAVAALEDEPWDGAGS